MRSRGYRTPAHLHRASGVGPDTIERRLNNKVTNPHDANIADVAAALGVSPAELRALVTGTPNDLAFVVIRPAQGAVKASKWASFIDSATSRLWLAEPTLNSLLTRCPNLLQRLTAKVEAGVDVRVVIADPHGQGISELGRNTGEGARLAHNAEHTPWSLTPPNGHTPEWLRVYVGPFIEPLNIADDTAWIGRHMCATPTAATPLVALTEDDHPAIANAFHTSYTRLWDDSQSPAPLTA
jgi:hypothetical protein